MKKLSILLLAVFYIGIANVSAQTENQTESKLGTDTDDQKITLAQEETKKCAKTGKICDSSCEKKKTKSCCKGKKSATTCSKSKKGSFNFNKSNDYAKVKSSCSKSAKKSCCKKKEASTDTNEKKDVQIEEANETDLTDSEKIIKVSND